MRIFVSIFLFLLFLSQTISSFVLDGAYWLNKDYVAQTLCINKANKQLHCDGKCFLQKQVAKENKDNTQPSGSKKERMNGIYDFFSAESVMPAAIDLYNTSYNLFIPVSLSACSHSILKPPRSFFV